MHVKALTLAVAALLATLAFAPTALAKTTTLRASLAGGAAEVPTGAPNASAKATITLDSTKGRVCWKFTKLKGVSNPNAAHIHEGLKGKAGAVLVPFGAAYKSKGCQTSIAKRIINKIVAHPGRYYVNIHNSGFPAGAVRGQLKK